MPKLQVIVDGYTWNVWESLTTATNDLIASCEKLKLTLEEATLGELVEQMQAVVEDVKADAVEAAAQATHEANRAFCVAIGDLTQVEWAAAPDWQKESARHGVRGVLAGNGPRESHQSWLEHKAADGWKWGAEKNPETKEHPCFVYYDALPPEQRAKNDIFVTVARAVLNAFNLEVPRYVNRQEEIV